MVRVSSQVGAIVGAVDSSPMLGLVLEASDVQATVDFTTTNLHSPTFGDPSVAVSSTPLLPLCSSLISFQIHLENLHTKHSKF